MGKMGCYLFAVFFVLLCNEVKPQTVNELKKETWADRGDVFGVIFANFHSDLKNEETERGFEVKRAYLGYKTKLDDHFSANIKLDIGSPDDVSEYSLKKRFAYFKNAYVQYKIGKFSTQVGISDCQQFKVQEKFWGYRYIYQSFQDVNKFGPSADMGVLFDYVFSDKISLDASFLNGEGYNQIQTDEDFKTSIGATYTPFKQLTLRLYYDSGIAYRYNQSDLAGFVGVKFDKFSLGGEYNHQWNNKAKENHRMYGYSFFGTYQLASKFKLFGRYDHLFSNTLEGEINPWNLSNDGSSVISGIEYTPIKNAQIAINYQDKIAYAENGTDLHYVYVNLQFNF